MSEETSLRRSGRTRNLPSVLAPVPPKIGKRQYASKQQVAEAKEFRKPNISNTLIFDESDPVHTSVFKRYFPGKRPNNLIFVYYDNYLDVPSAENPSLINGQTLQQISNGGEYSSEIEYPVYVQKFKFDKASGGVSRDTVMIKYNGKNTKIKYGPIDPNTQYPGNIPLSMFYTEEFDPVSAVYKKYFGTFLLNQNQSSFGKKRKKVDTLSRELKYLLSL
jgi:hypothetical protein